MPGACAWPSGSVLICRPSCSWCPFESTPCRMTLAYFTGLPVLSFNTRKLTSQKFLSFLSPANAAIAQYCRIASKRPRKAAFLIGIPVCLYSKQREEREQSDTKKAAHGRAAPSASKLLARLLVVACNAQIVGHAEDVRNAPGSDIGDVFVGLVINHAGQRYMTVFNNDANALHCLPAVFLKLRRAVNGPERGPANLVVHVRRRQLPDLIVYRLDAFNPLDHIPSIALQAGRGGRPEQRDGVALDFKGEIVKHRVIRQHHELVPNLASDAVLLILLRAVRHGFLCILIGRVAGSRFL